MPISYLLLNGLLTCTIAGLMLRPEVKRQVIIWYFYLGIPLMVVSNYYLESGVYVTELARESYYTGSTLRLQLVIIFLLSTVILLEKSIPKISISSRCGARTTGLDIGVIMVAIGIIALSYMNIAMSGPLPILGDRYIDRFSYIEGTALWPIMKYFGKVPLISVVAAGVIYHKYLHRGPQLYKFGAVIVLIAYFVYVILIGHKFGPVLAGLFYFFLPRLVETDGRSFWEFIKGKGALIGLAILACLMSLVTYHATRNTASANFDGGWDFVLYRIFALSGHVWWAADEYVFVQDGSAFFNADALINGMEAMMLNLSSGYGAEMLDRGVYMTRGFPANIIYSMPIYFYPVALTVSMAAPILLGRFYKATIRAESTLGMIAGAYFILWTSAVLIRGSLNLMLGYDVVIMAFIFGFAIILRMVEGGSYRPALKRR